MQNVISPPGKLLLVVLIDMILNEGIIRWENDAQKSFQEACKLLAASKEEGDQRFGQSALV